MYNINTFGAKKIQQACGVQLSKQKEKEKKHSLQGLVTALAMITNPWAFRSSRVLIVSGLIKPHEGLYQSRSLGPSAHRNSTSQSFQGNRTSVMETRRITTKQKPTPDLLNTTLPSYQHSSRQYQIRTSSSSYVIIPLDQLHVRDHGIRGYHRVPLTLKQWGIVMAGSFLSRPSTQRSSEYPEAPLSSKVVPPLNMTSAIIGIVCARMRV